MANNKISYANEYVAKEDEGNLLDQFYVSLQTSLFQIKNNQQIIDKEINELIINLLSDTKSWSNAYKIEQLIVELYDENTLTYILKRRLTELENVLSPNQVNFYKEECLKAVTFEQKRAILEQLIDDLQWNYAIREQKMKYARFTRRRSNYALLCSIIFFLISIFFSLAEVVKYEFLNIIIMLSAGSIGASFSLLTSIRDIENFPFNSLKIIHRFGYIISRISIGAVAALIVYYFIQSNLIGGELFQSDDTSNYKLIVWCFIAGFSEKLIPQLMIQSETKLTQNTSINLPANVKTDKKTDVEIKIETKTEEKIESIENNENKEDEIKG